jgi:hypothetical protein
MPKQRSSKKRRSVKKQTMSKQKKWLTCMKPSDPMIRTLTTVQKKMRSKLRKSKRAKKMCTM